MFRIETLASSDVPRLLGIIRSAREEFGLASRLVYVLEPADVALMETYAGARSEYFVAHVGSKIAGGAGIAPLRDLEAACELQRMYLCPAYRSQGIGKALLDACVSRATKLGYQACYAETIHEMTGAIALYKSRGFRILASPLGATGHTHNDRWLYLDLANSQ